MRKRQASEIAAKQVRNAQANSEEYTRGVGSVQVAPGQLAVAKQNKLRNEFLKSLDSGKWADNTSSVGLEEWKRRTMSVGGRNYATGVADSQDKTQQFWEDFLPFLENVQQQVSAMPDETEAQREQKVLENMRLMRQYKRRRTPRR